MTKIKNALFFHKRLQMIMLTLCTLLLLTTHALSLAHDPISKAKQDATNCKKYKKVEIGQLFESVRTTIGKPSKVEKETTMNYTWRRGHYQFNASFSDGKFNYASYFGFMAEGPPPKVFVEADKFRPANVTELNKLLGKPTKHETVITYNYRYILPGKTHMMINVDGQGKITGKSIGLMCQ